MAVSSTRARSTGDDDADDRSPFRKGGEITGLVLVALSVALALAIFSFSPADLEPEAVVQNLIGPVGAYAADILLYIFGVGALLIVVVLFLLGGFMVVGRRPELKPSEFVGYGLFVFSGALLCHLALDGELLFGHGAGGLVGELLGELLVSVIGSVGTYIVATSTTVLALMLVTDMSLGNLVMGTIGLVRDATGDSGGRLAEWRDGKRDAREERKAERQERADEKRAAREEERDAKVTTKRKAKTKAKTKTKRRVKKPVVADLSIDESLDASLDGDGDSLDQFPDIGEGDAWSFGQVDLEPGASPSFDLASSVAESLDGDSVDPSVDEPAEVAETPVSDTFGPQIVESSAQREAKERREKLESDEPVKLRPRQPSNFVLPPVSFLNYDAPSDDLQIDKGELRHTALELEKTLKSFGVEGKVVEICPGPVITMFEFLPKPGIKLSKIAGLADDLAMAIAAISVRIIAPIPGKGVVGIEVPNASREMVYLKEIIAADEFSKSKAGMPMALGKGTDGEPVIADLAKMPHLLVAGATGSGKSVAVNTMIVSLLFRFTPDEVRLIMVDPKMLEFSIYEGIPHLLLPVVTDPKKAAIALNWAVDEMERRYHLLSELHVRNIDNYNKKVTVMTKQAELDLLEGRNDSDAVKTMKINAAGDPKHVKLPRIVCIVDEFADLMMVASKDVEICVARLAQKARAAGLHVILATQRPSVDVVTGLIKANFPTRIALRVAQRTDSRTILDANGAENLLGRGDMLFLPPGSSAQSRVHGAFVSEFEIDKIVAHLKEQGEPDYDASLLTYGEEKDETKSKPEDHDEHYDQAVRIVTTDRKASISMLQRKLRVGYNRAARMIEVMESEGIIGPADGSAPRKILAPPPA